MSDINDDLKSLAGRYKRFLDDCGDNRGFWRTKDGHTILISSMDDNHLRNAIALLKRRADCSDDGWDSLDAEKLDELIDEAHHRLRDETRLRRIIREEIAAAKKND